MADYTRLISEVIQKHKDNPEVQKDLKKVLAYAAAESRFFFRQFTHEDQRPEHSQETRTINAIADSFTQEN